MKYKSLPEPHTATDELKLFNEMWSVKPKGTMIIAMRSILTNITHFAELAITNDQVDKFTKGLKVQDAFPNLSADEREFLLNGIVPGELEAMFPEQ